MLIIDIQNPTKPAEYLLHWQNKLNVGNVGVSFMKEEKEDGNHNTYLILGYKIIGINTFNVKCINLKTKLIEYWHESNNLWEQPVTGFLLSTNDFMILNKDGINIIAIGEKPSRVIKDKNGQDTKIHALGSCNYLKIEPTNHIMFGCQFSHKRVLCIQEQYVDNCLNTRFEDIFEVRIHQLTLRELLFMQSLYLLKTQSEIEKLVLDQPSPKIFYKTNLDLGLKSLLNYISFDSRSMKLLLSEDNNQCFDDKYPLFYKNEKGFSDIDLALERNQIRSVNLMINYVVNYQNHYSFSNLF